MIQWKIDKIKNIIKERYNNILVFIHTPKCYGTYLSFVLKDVGIKNNGQMRILKIYILQLSDIQ